MGREMQPFFITGTPRSRTAWLSVVATSGASVCLHEPGFGDVESARAVWAKGTPSRIGIADAGLGLHLRAILAEFRPRTLIVERPIADVIASFHDYFRGHLEGGWEALVRDQLGNLQAALQIADPLVKRMPFADLDNIEEVQGALAWLGIREPPNLEGMMHMNVQSSVCHNLAKLRALREAA